MIKLFQFLASNKLTLKAEIIDNELVITLFNSGFVLL